MPSAPAELAMILDRSFAIDPNHRYGSAAELADAIEALLTSLGGGVLSARTAALDVLGSLDLASKPPPSPQSSTTGPLSVDPSKADKTQLSPQGPVTGSGPTTSPRSSATSFAETEVAAGIEPRARRAEAVSEARERPSPARSKHTMARIAGAALAVAVVGGVIAVVKYRAGDPGAPVAHEPASSFSGAAAIAPVPPTPPVASSTSAPAAAPVASVAATPSASASAAPPPVHASPTRRAPPRPAASATVSRPRIDQSGL
jgi:hypothetical protein